VASVAELLQLGVDRLRAAGSETARLDAELLLARAIGVDRMVVIAHPEAPVSTSSEASFIADLDRRAAGEPVAYIRGFKEFFGLALAVDPRALIPRPETERLVELAEREVMTRLTRAPRPIGTPRLRIVDVGTGGGAVAIALGVALRRRKMLNEVEILGTDISPEALALAQENAVGHGVADRVRFIEADLLPPVVATPFEVLLANLPYVRSDAMPGLPVAASFEPSLALDGGPLGLTLIEGLVDRLPEALSDDGTALLEIGGDQGELIVQLVRDRLPAWEVVVERDLAGQPRVARVERENAARS
jgi:release factor glutamine methyltransferase